jgi:glutamate-1-semialdehyde aminotransferase
MRLARHVTGRKKVVLFENSYHGLSDGVLVRNVDDNGRRVTRPVIPAIPEGVVDAVVVLPYGVAETLAEIRARSGELAAVLVEPVQSRNPALQPRAFLQELREITSEHGVALIFDEIITGLRCAPGGAQAWFGVPADLATYGKVLAGGVPLGAIAGRRAFMDAIDGGAWQFGDDSYPRSTRTFFGGTHSQNPLALAGAAAVLEHLRREGPGLQRQLNERCAAMVGELDGLLGAERVGLRLASFASLFRFVPERTNLLETNLFLHHMWQNGVLLSDIGNNFLSVAHGDAEVTQVVDAVRHSIRDLRRGGYFTVGDDRVAATGPAAVSPAPVASPTPPASPAPASPPPPPVGSLLSRIVGQLERSR